MIEKINYKTDNSIKIAGRKIRKNYQNVFKMKETHFVLYLYWDDGSNN